MHTDDRNEYCGNCYSCLLAVYLITARICVYIHVHMCHSDCYKTIIILSFIVLFWYVYSE